MIQRIQTLWLLLAGACGILTYKFPFYSGTEKLENMPSVAAELNAASNLFILVLTGILIALCLYTIFLYKHRKKQMTYTVIGILFAILILVIYFLQIRKYDHGSIALWSIFAFAMPVCMILAAQGIWRDEKLVKSLDRLR
jgi:high-affinity Fe2+/Pb2+ permease